jgi:hypothetical protein
VARQAIAAKEAEEVEVTEVVEARPRSKPASERNSSYTHSVSLGLRLLVQGKARRVQRVQL